MMSEFAAGRPEVTPPGEWQLPVPQTTRLPSGLTVHAYHVPGQYVVSLRLTVPLALRVEPRDKEGVAALMARLLDEGTARHSTDEYTELLERGGIGFAAGLSDGGLRVDMDVPQRRLEQALDLMCAAVAEPAFPQRQVDRLIRTRLAEIGQERASSPHRAAKELAATYFDAGERASRPTGGTPATVSALTRADLVAFHAAHVGPTHATIVVAGDLTGIDAADSIGTAFAGWAPVPVPERHVFTPARPADEAARIVLVDRPGSVQSEIAVACAGPDRHVDPSWAAYPVLSFIVGGSPNARVDSVLREQRGFTYGMRSSFRPRRAGGLFVTTGSVRTEVTAEAIALLLDILDRGRDGFTDDERRDGVDFLRNTAPGRFAMADAIADEASGTVLDNLPLSFTSDTLAAMGELTVADLDAAYRRWVDGKWCIVVVGDATAYADALRGLGRGDVSVVPN